MFTEVKDVGRRGRGLLEFIVLAMLALPAIATAGPQVIEETARITAPDPTYRWPSSVAIDGDWLIATGSREDIDAGVVDSSAWLYQRQSNGQWTLVRRLLQYFVIEDGDEPGLKVDMQGGIAAFVKENVSWIFERSGSNWTSVPSPITTDGMDVEVDNGTIVVTAGSCEWIANAYRKGTNGAWALVRSTPGEPWQDCENEDTRGDADVSGTAIIVATYSDTGPPNSARVFEGPFGATPTMTRVDSTGFTSQPVAIDGTSALVGRHPPGDTGVSALVGRQLVPRGRTTAAGQFCHPATFAGQGARRPRGRRAVGRSGTGFANRLSLGVSAPARWQLQLCCQAVQQRSRREPHRFERCQPRRGLPQARMTLM